MITYTVQTLVPIAFRSKWLIGRWLQRVYLWKRKKICVFNIKVQFDEFDVGDTITFHSQGYQAIVIAKQTEYYVRGKYRG